MSHKFDDNLLKVSQSKSMPEAKQEWIYLGNEKCNSGDQTCLCTNHNIKTVYYFGNKFDNTIIRTGGSCKTKLLPGVNDKTKPTLKDLDDFWKSRISGSAIYDKDFVIREYLIKSFTEYIAMKIDNAKNIPDLNECMDICNKSETRFCDDNDFLMEIQLNKEAILEHIKEMEKRQKEEQMKRDIKNAEDDARAKLNRDKDMMLSENYNTKKPESLYRKNSNIDYVTIQPCDWIESDSNFKYVVDVFGRTEDEVVAKVRLTGFQPYFYLKSSEKETAFDVSEAIERCSGKSMRGLKVTQEQKLDAMRGFTGLIPTKVWRISCPALWMFKVVVKTLKDNVTIKGRKIQTEDIYESNLPPFIRLFHERDISPASPITFPDQVSEIPEGCNVDICYEISYTDVSLVANKQIPLLVGSYDLEVYSDSGQFPVSSNPKDEIIQIGISCRWTDTLLESADRKVFVLGTVTPSQDPGVTFVSCKTERDLLIKFRDYIHSENPDILCGYNTFGFDDAYIADRAQRCGIELHFGRIDSRQWGDRKDNVKTEKKTFELASGKFAVRYIDMPGRLGIDLYLSMRREQNLDSYKLDNIASTFLRDKVLKFERLTSTRVKLTTKSTRGMFTGNLVRLDVVTNTINPYKEGFKFPVVDMDKTSFVIETEDTFEGLDVKKLEWSFAKDDVDHHDIFNSHRGTADDRAFIAKYCIQDCDLVLTLMAKLDTLVNARGMADVCRVPIQYIFLRGQGIKIFSAVVYNASKRNQIIMTQESVEGDMAYEGAIVLPPKIGMYLDQPIPVLDFNSLYPSNMIAYNLSPDTLVYVKEVNAAGRTTRHDIFGNADGYKVDDVMYDIKDEEGNEAGRVYCGFAQPTENPITVGLLPMTLEILLKKRKETRKLIETTEDDAQKSVLNGLQLAYKVVANSVYGQCGSKTSPIRRLEVAACTTAVGRQKIFDAKKIIEEQFGGEVVYGDTDSLFVKFMTKSLPESIELAKQAATAITASGRKAHKIEYEKTFLPFILFCRKRYMGMMYEDDIKKCKRKSMGIAIKRRDSAPIVKDIFGGALDILMEERDIRKAQKFVQDMLVQVMQNKMPLEKYIITKQLRDDYKVPGQIAHRVLADRMEERDPGNKPQVGDRLAYLYVAERKNEKKQGDKIEHVDYAREKGLKPDVEFYITNQLQNPISQLFALALEQLDGYRPSIQNNYKAMYHAFLDDGMDEEEATLKVLAKKEKELDSIMFLKAPHLQQARGQKTMDMFMRR
jgi:DNA polymerase elongation subunit (family B)